MVLPRREETLWGALAIPVEEVDTRGLVIRRGDRVGRLPVLQHPENQQLAKPLPTNLIIFMCIDSYTINISLVG